MNALEQQFKYLVTSAKREGYKIKVEGDNVTLERDTSISTVGRLRACIDGWPDDTLILCQTVRQGGEAYNMFGDLKPVDDNKLALILSHPDF